MNDMKDTKKKSEIKQNLFKIIRIARKFVNYVDIYRIICPLSKKNFSSRNEEAKNCTVEKSGCCLIFSNFL
jgi:hypothetical protein